MSANVDFVQASSYCALTNMTCWLNLWLRQFQRANYPGHLGVRNLSLSTSIFHFNVFVKLSKLIKKIHCWLPTRALSII